jgi:hypothetical protein
MVLDRKSSFSPIFYIYILSRRALQLRNWTSERRWRLGLQDSVATCYTCLQDQDSEKHILAGCVYAREVWLGCFHRFGLVVAIPEVHDSLQSWWFRVRRGFMRRDRRGFDSLVILIGWRLWKQRNARFFQNTRKQFDVQGLVNQILQEWKQWYLAGLGGSSNFARVVH